jgi:hypothetical protein
MNQRILHVTLNTGRMAVQRPEAIPPNALQVLRPRVVRLLKRPPSERRKWLGRPAPVFPFELNNQENSTWPLFWVRWGGDKKALARLAVGTGSAADAELWALIHQLGRHELPKRPVTHPLYRPRAPWCATVHHQPARLHDPTTAAQLGALERGVTWAVVHLTQGKERS